MDSGTGGVSGSSSGSGGGGGSKMKCTYCGMMLSRENLPSHMSEKCSERNIKCPYRSYGCTDLVKAKGLSFHLKYNKLTHVSLKLDHVSASHEKKLENLYNIISEQQSTITSMKKSFHELSGKYEALVKSTSVQLARLQREEIPQILVLRGNDRWEESGVFLKRSFLHQGRVCYTSMKTKCAIRWNNRLTAWFIDRRGLCFDDETSMIAYEDVMHPLLVTVPWYVYNDSIQKWVKSHNYSIRGYSFTEFFLGIDQVTSEMDLPVINTATSQSSSLSTRSQSAGGAIAAGLGMSGVSGGVGGGPPSTISSSGGPPSSLSSSSDMRRAPNSDVSSTGSMRGLSSMSGGGRRSGGGGGGGGGSSGSESAVVMDDDFMIGNNGTNGGSGPMGGAAVMGGGGIGGSNGNNNNSGGVGGGSNGSGGGGPPNLDPPSTSMKGMSASMSHGKYGPMKGSPDTSASGMLATIREESHLQPPGFEELS